jgi:hypothetical protein
VGAEGDPAFIYWDSYRCTTMMAQHRPGPGEPLTKPVAEDIPLEAFYVEKGAEGRTLACANCTMRFDEKSKLEAAIEHYRSHMRPHPSEVEEAVEEGAPTARPVLERPKREPRPKGAPRPKKEGRGGREEKGQVWFTFHLPAPLLEQLKRTDGVFGDKSRAEFIRDEWEKAVKADKFPQTKTEQKLEARSIWVPPAMAKQVDTMERKGDFNFDFWLIHLCDSRLKKSK